VNERLMLHDNMGGGCLVLICPTEEWLVPSFPLTVSMDRRVHQRPIQRGSADLYVPILKTNKDKPVSPTVMTGGGFKPLTDILP
jgi:hypothetical protein